MMVTSIFWPYYLSDCGNSFFKAFVTHELLSVLGVIVTITLASAASLHLELNKLEESTGEAFQEARSAVRLSAYALIVCFLLALALVVAKPMLDGNMHASALFNSAAVALLLFSLGVMADLTAAVFGIPAIKK